MGRFYHIPLAAAAFTAAGDLFEVTVAAEKPVRLWYLALGQTTELGDAAEEQLRVTFQTAVTAGSGGSSQTPTGVRPADASAGLTSTSRTTVHTGGTVRWTWPWNVRVPLEHWWTLENAPEVTSSTDPFTITIDAPADSITIFGMLLVEEII